MKKTIAAFIALVIFGFNVAATPNTNKTHNWFFKSSSNGEQPLVFDGNKMPDKYGSIYLGDKQEKKIYLTFDAGYGNENVQATLDILKKHNIQAAFFILPGIIKNNLSMVEQMISDGHLICNHTYSHKNISKCSGKDDLQNELTKLEDLYYEYTGKEMEKFFRPPEGSFTEANLKQLQEMGYTTVFWSFAYADWDNNSQKDVSWAKEKVLSNLHNGMVVLLHPNSATNAAILDDVLTEAKAQGYSFGSLYDIKN